MEQNNNMSSTTSDAQSIGSSKEQSKAYSSMLSKVKKHCPPLEIIDKQRLPSLINGAMKLYEANAEVYGRTEYSIILLSQMTLLSCCFPNVRLPYGSNRYSLNLSLVIGAPSGSNKSTLSLLSRILNKLNEYIIADYTEEKKEWSQKMELWKLEKRKAANCKSSISLNFKHDPGEEPRYAALIIPATISKSMIVDMMKGNERWGNILISTEADSVNDANSKDYGQMCDVFNKALVNETVDKAFRIDGSPVTIDNPMLSLLVSGTYDQIHRFIPNFETGFGSRLLTFLSAGLAQFNSQKPVADGIDFKKYYKSMGEEVLRMWKFFVRFNVLVTFTDSQWKEHTEMWSENFEDVKAGHLEMLSVATRFGLHHMRIAGVLAMLRSWDEVKDDTESHASVYAMGDAYEIVCTDEDFHTAGMIASKLFEHAMMFSTTKVAPLNIGVKEMENWHWQHNVLEAMQDTFCVTDFITVAMAEPFNKSSKTCYRVLAKMSKGKNKLIKKLKAKIDGKACFEKVKKVKK